MTPNPEDRLGGSDGLEFEPVKTRPKPKRHWGRWVSFAVIITVGAGGGWYYFGDQFPMASEKQVPVIRAEVTPIKIKPADPGGMDIPDRDKLVYDRLNGESAGTTVERLLPPPETPLPIPESQLQDASSEPASVPPPAPPEPLPPEPLVPGSAPAELQSTIEQMADTAMEPAAELDDNAPVPLQPSTVMKATEETAEEMAEEPATQTSSGETASLAPPPPPAPVTPVETAPVSPTPLQPASSQAATTQTQVATTTAETITSQATTTSVATTQSAASATTAQTKEYRIQLAALRTHKRAETEWNRQKKAHPDILGALKLFVVRVDLGGDQGVFYRLRAGPLKDAAAAKALCGELAKRNVGCLVIRPGK